MSLALLAGASQTALAQDWSGGYAGVHAGARWVDSEFSSPAYTFPDGFGGTAAIPARNESYSVNDGIGGIHGGYNFPLSPFWLFGIETDLTAGGSDDTRSAHFLTSHTETTTNTVITTKQVFVPECECFREVETKQTVTLQQNITTQQKRVSNFETGWQGTTRLRFGFVTGGLMFYGTAGVAYMQTKWSDTINVVGGTISSVTDRSILTGWVVGGGLEGFLTPNLLGRVEYLYEDFGGHSVPLAFTQNQGKIDVVAQKLRVGLSVKF